MLKLFTLLTALFMSGQASANPACPVCTIAIGASLSIARKMGVDDCIVGIWAGAFLAIIGYWLIRWFDKKNWQFRFRDPLLMILSVGSIGFMYLGELHYDPSVIGIFYLDSFLFAAILGALTFIGAMRFYEWMKYQNGGHAHFPFEKVVVPLLAVFILSLIFNYLPICNCHAAVGV